MGQLKHGKRRIFDIGLHIRLVLWMKVKEDVVVVVVVVLNVH